MSALGSPFCVACRRVRALVHRAQMHTALDSIRTANLHGMPNPEEFSPRRVLVFSKITRYEYEARSHPDMNEEQLRRALSDKGSDYDGLLARHKMHHKLLEKLLGALEKKNIEVRLVERMMASDDDIDWGDMAISAGGDGTFLLAASKICRPDRPIVGFNTDPLRSEGFLCMSKRLCEQPHVALNLLLSGRFRWQFRKRLRIIMSGLHVNDAPVELHEMQMNHPEYRFVEHVKEHEEDRCSTAEVFEHPARQLPVLALNECFVGESLSARVSYYEISVDGSPPEKQKSSGVTLCTGTGSSSWSFHINHLSPEQIGAILTLAARHCSPKARFSVNCGLPHLQDLNTLQQIEREYNYMLRFDPEELRMAYTVRDPVINGVFQVSKRRGFAQRVRIRSRMWDAHVVVDGGSSFRFNDGAVAEFDINHPEDALCCMQPILDNSVVPETGKLIGCPTTHPACQITSKYIHSIWLRVF